MMLICLNAIWYILEWWKMILREELIMHLLTSGVFFCILPSFFGSGIWFISLYSLMSPFNSFSSNSCSYIYLVNRQTILFIYMDYCLLVFFTCLYCSSRLKIYIYIFVYEFILVVIDSSLQILKNSLDLKWYI